MMSHSAR